MSDALDLDLTVPVAGRDFARFHMDVGLGDAILDPPEWRVKNLVGLILLLQFGQLGGTGKNGNTT